MRNVHKVPKKQWRKWSETARKVFNEVYYTLRHNTGVLFPPTAQNLSRQAIKVIAWNTAWIAADAANSKPKGA